jgi:hypothetical protein
MDLPCPQLRSPSDLPLLQRQSDQRGGAEPHPARPAEMTVLAEPLHLLQAFNRG